MKRVAEATQEEVPVATLVAKMTVLLVVLAVLLVAKDPTAQLAELEDV